MARPVTKGATVQLNVRISPDLEDAIWAYAEKSGMTKTDLVILAVQRLLKVKSPR